ncbi:unnamed protein product [Acanthoscelides obtectus]|uniref:Uncharacterized protein n=1 Tax=Acanthoscelides obtectus TaxID=200917 RepID=A0A9P0PST4_ACAOB|nr:unnamed protein product [Acanthoscelides obtectus]CAK1673261.1 hypothetical protein AOBTE_LOCUS29278 [Acanthoscelides obtectus]
MTTWALVYSGVCTLLGYSAFVTFIILGNYPAAVLGFVSGSTDALSFFLHHLNRRGQLYAWYSHIQLRHICRLGIIIASVGLLSIGYYATMQISLRRPAMPIPQSLTIPLVFSFITLRSGLILMYQTIRYQENEEPHLLPEESRRVSSSSNSSSDINSGA